MIENRLIELPGRNKYLLGFGYLTNHVPEKEDRSAPLHWELQYQNLNLQAFSAWQPRPGPLEFIHSLAMEQLGGDIRNHLVVLNMGAGKGDLSVGLARISGVKVIHVDYSENANNAAKKLSKLAGVGKRLEIVTAGDTAFLEELISKGSLADVVFSYGNVGGNIPQENEFMEKVQLHIKASKPNKGYLWYVGLEQPGLLDPNDESATDILGEYPTLPGLSDMAIERLLGSRAIVRSVSEVRPDNHPLVPEGPIVEHTHVVRRALYQNINVPEFGFTDAVNPNWPEIWERLRR